MEKKKKIDGRVNLIHIVGGILGIGILLYSGYSYGIELPIILFLAIFANNLCNVK